LSRPGLLGCPGQCLLDRIRPHARGRHHAPQRLAVLLDITDQPVQQRAQLGALVLLYGVPQSRNERRRPRQMIVEVDGHEVAHEYAGSTSSPSWAITLRRRRADGVREPPTGVS
jgi:hypothetical protein